MYKTLPSSLRRKAASSSNDHHHQGDLPSLERPPSPTESSVFGGIHLNISNLFTGGVSQFLGQFRKKTPSSPTSPAPSSSSSSQTTSLASSSSHPPSPLSRSSNASSSLRERSSTLNRSSLTDDVASPSSSSFEEVESFELIEFPFNSEGTGSGHTFFNAPSSNPTWCDHCGQIIWGIYDNVGSKCSLCDLTCHKSCVSRVRLDCNAEKEEEDTLIDVSDLSKDEEEQSKSLPQEEDVDEEGTLKVMSSMDSSFEGPDDTLLGDPPLISKSDSVYCLSQALNGSQLSSSLESYNLIFPPGQKSVLEVDDKINGFIRVTMNLRRPINVIAGMRPPSIYRMDESMEKQRTLTTFHLAPNTVKAIHVTSTTSTRDVIRFLLAKFRIADNPHKYALYERYSSNYSALSHSKHDSKTLSRIQMRRIAEDELPLLLALRWAVNDLLDQRSLVLQENDPGEICWEAFSLPELKNFLVILDREEAWYKKSIHEKYDHIRKYMEELLIKKGEENERNS